ncbi:MAG: endonuclease NucS domain-containing protein [Rhodospirillaceae bacterium]
MQEQAFDAYMVARNLADRTRATRVNALRRIERAYQCDLDQEFEADSLARLLGELKYTAADGRARRPNPSRIEIEPDRVLPHLRWYRSHLMDYARFRGGAPIEDDAEVESATTPAGDEELIQEFVGSTFALERDLQAALRANLHQLETGLVVADGGRERQVGAGFIDILARDASGTLTVIELKSETAKPEALTQILSYMGCLAEESGEPIRGILVAGDHHPRIQHAVRAVPNVALKKYRFRFEFE